MDNTHLNMPNIMLPMFFMLGMLLFSTSAFGADIVQVGESSKEDIRFYGQQDANLTLTDNCYSDGANCDALVPCNITITGESFILANQPMTNIGSSINYIFQNTSDIGKYQASVVCTDSGVSQFDRFDFIINKDGVETNGKDSIIFGVLATLMLLAGLGASYFKKGLRRAFILLTGLMVPVILFTAYAFAQNALLGGTIISLTLFGYTTSLILYLALVLYILWDLTMELKLKNNASYGGMTTGTLVKAKKEKQKKDYEDDESFFDND